MLTFFSPPGHPADERRRQQAVIASGLRDGARDGRLRSLIEAAAALFGTDMAALSLIDADRQLFLARLGLPMAETTRAVSFCGHTILTPDRPTVIADAAADARFSGNPLVRGETGARFYAGVAVRGIGGQPLGALCVLGREPRDAPQPLAQLAELARFAEQVIAERSCPMKLTG